MFITFEEFPSDELVVDVIALFFFSAECFKLPLKMSHSEQTQSVITM